MAHLLISTSLIFLYLLGQLSGAEAIAVSEVQPPGEMQYVDDGSATKTVASTEEPIGEIDPNSGAVKNTLGPIERITDEQFTDAVTDPPTTVTDAPTTVTDPPTTVSDPPTTVIDPPTTVTDPPNTVTDPPTTLTDSPTTVTDPPTTVTDPPTTVTETVPTTTIEPTTTVIVTTTAKMPEEMTDMIGQIYGPGLSEAEIKEKTDELVENPAQVQDYVPNIMGDLKEEARTNISWTAKDMFLYVAVDGERIDYEANFIQWNDRTLGNCFTLNHFDSKKMYNIGPIGIEVMMRLYESEYVPWMQTSAIIVYTHSNKETVFSESPGVVCRGGTHTWMQVKPGCLRSCYQDVMKTQCGCMDSRYATPPGEKACSIALQSCIDNIVNTRNDLSQWSECNCPQPCNNDIYDTQWSATRLMQQDLNCDNSTANCSVSDIAIMRLVLPAVTSQVFIEEPAVDFVRFLSSMGGIMGLFFGFSMIACFEVLFLCWTLCYITGTGTYKKMPDKDDRQNIFNGRKRYSR